MGGLDGLPALRAPGWRWGPDLAIILGIWAHSSRRLLLNAWPSIVSRWRRRWLRPQLRDEPQYLLEHLPWDGDLGHLEGDIAAVAHDLRADLDELFLQARQRPILIGSGVASVRKKLPRL
jgi:hypothetical protein